MAERKMVIGYELGGDDPEMKIAGEENGAMAARLGRLGNALGAMMVAPGAQLRMATEVEYDKEPEDLCDSLVDQAECTEGDRIFAAEVRTGRFDNFLEHRWGAKLMFISCDLRDDEQYRAEVGKVIEKFAVMGPEFPTCIRFLPTSWAVFTMRSRKEIEERLRSVIREEGLPKILVRPLSGAAVWWGGSPWVSATIPELMGELRPYQGKTSLAAGT